MSSNKRKVAPSPKSKGQRSATSKSGSESSVPSRYYSTTTAASSSVALSDTDNDNNITITGHPTQSLFDWTPSEQSTTVDFSYTDAEAPSDNTSEKNTTDYSGDSDEELRKPWWKSNRVMLGIAFAVAGLLAVILGATLSWVYLSPSNANVDDASSNEGFFVGPYETKSLNERIADKHVNRGRLHRGGRSGVNQVPKSGARQREYSPVNNRNPYRKHRKNKTKASGKRKQEGRFLDFGKAEQGPFNGNVNRYAYDQLKRRKQQKHYNKAQNTDIRNFTNPVATDSAKSVEIPKPRSPPARQLVEKKMIPQNGFKFPFKWTVDKKFFECPPSGCSTKLDITHKNGLRNKKTGSNNFDVPFNDDSKLYNSTFRELLYKFQENMRKRLG